MPGNGELGRRDPRAEPVQPVELAAPERGAVDAGPGQRRTEGAGSTTIVRPGALTQLLADLARAPEGAGWDVPLEPGQSVGRFEIQREIGRGGFGVVYEARDYERGLSVAFKAIRASGADAAREARLLGEAEAAARLAHPNIVHLYDVGRSEQGAFLIMELLRGQTLSEKLREGPLPLREAVRIAVEISRGLAHAHEQGVVHRDLKPSNVFLCDDCQVKVLDFGLAHVFERAGIAGGTPAYMAPEQAQGETGDERSDVYSLGVVIREMLTGKLPVPSPSPPPDATDAPPLSPAAAGERGQPTVTSAGVRGKPAMTSSGAMTPTGMRGQIAPTPSGVPTLPGAPAVLSKLVTRMLELDPAKRPSDGAEAHQHLAAIQKSLEPRRLLWAALSVAAAALVGAGTFAYFWQRPLPPGRLLTALADTDNQTGDPDLDAISELLRTGLEQSKRISVMARSRLVNALREAGGMAPRAIDEALARRAAEHAQARIVIVPAARQTGAGFDLSLRAVDLARGEPLFQVQETAQGKGSVPEALQRLVAGARKALREDAGEAKEAPISVAAIAPANPEALRHYAEGRRAETAGEAAEAYRRALEADPDFPLAHLELAFWYEQRDFEATLRHIDAARRNLQRLPPKERVLVDAIATIYGDGSHFELLQHVDRAIANWPEEPRPYEFARNIMLDSRGDAVAARPYLEKALVIAALDEDATIVYLLCLERLDEALARARRWTETNPGYGSYELLAVVHRHRGETALALEAARRAASFDPAGRWPGSLTIMRALLDAGALDELEELGRDPATPPDTRGPWLSLHGRWREALRLADEQRPPEDGPATARGFYHWKRASLLAQSGAPADDVWREVEEQFRSGVGGGHLYGNAIHLALLGDLDRANRLMEGFYFPDHSGVVRLYRHIQAWKRGDRDAALRGLAQLYGYDSDFYRGTILQELGRDREAVEAFRRYRRRQPAVTSAHPFLLFAFAPRSLYLEAVSLDRLGDRARALELLDRLVRLWKRADPGAPMVGEARALHARLAAAGGRE